MTAYVNESFVDFEKAVLHVMTRTTKRIHPVVQVDDRVIGKGKPGSATILLNKLFLEQE